MRSRLIDYKIVSEGSNSTRTLEDLVKELMDVGWEPTGGVALVDGGASQAMVLYADCSSPHRVWNTP